MQLPKKGDKVRFSRSLLEALATVGMQLPSGDLILDDIVAETTSHIVAETTSPTIVTRFRLVLADNRLVAYMDPSGIAVGWISAPTAIGPVKLVDINVPIGLPKALLIGIYPLLEPPVAPVDERPLLPGETHIPPAPPLPSHYEQGAGLPPPYGLLSEQAGQAASKHLYQSSNCPRCGAKAAFGCMCPRVRP